MRVGLVFIGSFFVEEYCSELRLKLGLLLMLDVVYLGKHLYCFDPFKNTIEGDYERKHGNYKVISRKDPVV